MFALAFLTASRSRLTKFVALSLLAVAGLSLLPWVHAEEAKSEPEPIELSVVIAKHVMLLEGQEIITWEELTKKIASYPNPSLVYPHFYLTNGVFNTERYDEAKREMMQIHQDFNLHGHSEGSLWPARGVLYDKIKKAEDLVPDPALKVEGVVLDKQQKPVEGAEVLLVAPVDESLSYKGYHIALVTGVVRNRLEHVMTTSDAQGRFALYPPKDQPYYVVVLHPALGFAIVNDENLKEHHQCRLVEWASLIADIEPGKGEEYSATLTTSVQPDDNGRPEISFNQYWEDVLRQRKMKEEADGKMMFLCVPPLLKTVVSRSFPQPDGGAISVPDEAIEFFPGESRNLHLGPPTAEQLKQIEQTRQLLQRLRPAVPAARLRPAAAKPPEEKANGPEEKQSEEVDPKADSEKEATGNEAASTDNEANQDDDQSSKVQADTNVQAAAQPSQPVVPEGHFLFSLSLIDPDGQPVPKANVQVRNRPAIKAEQVLEGTFVKELRYGCETQTTDAGVLKLALPVDQPRLTLMVITPGYGPYWAQWDQSAPESFTGTLDRAWTIGGVIVDEEGQPIGDAEVHPSLEFKKRPGNDFQLAMGSSVKSDAQGHWKFESIPDSLQSVHVSVNHKAFASLRTELVRSDYEVKDGGELKTLNMSKGLSVVGLVMDESGEPVVGAKVMTRFSNEPREAVTDDKGKFILSGCEPTQARFVCFAPGKAFTKQDVLLQPEGNEPVNFTLKPGGHVRIRVVDPKGKPQPKTRIFFQKWGTEQVRYFEFDHVDQYANEEGIWEWNEAPLEGFEADVNPVGGMQIPNVPFTPRDEEYVVTTLPQLIIKGKVVDAQTKAVISECKAIEGIRFGDRISWSPRDSFESRDGTFTLRPGRAYQDGFVVRVEAKGYKASTSRPIKLDEGEVNLEFELQTAVDIFGKVLTPSGDPATGAKISMGLKGGHIGLRNGDLDDGQNSGQRAVADADGKFKLVPPGEEFQLVIVHPEGFAFLKSKDEQVEKITVLTAWAQVSGTYQIGDVLQKSLDLRLDCNRFWDRDPQGPSFYADYQTTTNEHGEFSFDRVFPGDVGISRELLFMVNEGARIIGSSKNVTVKAQAGQVATVKIGGTGRPVIGKFLPPEGFDGKPIWRRASISLDSTNRQVGLVSHWASSADGTFRIDDVDPGEYQLQMYFSEPPQWNLPAMQVQVKADETGVIDLGELQTMVP